MTRVCASSVRKVDVVTFVPVVITKYFRAGNSLFDVKKVEKQGTESRSG